MSKKETKDIYDNYNALSVGDQPRPTPIRKWLQKLNQQRNG